MHHLIEYNLAKFRFAERQEFFWKETGIFFEWCQWNLRACVEQLDPATQGQFASGKLPTQLAAAVRADMALSNVDSAKASDSIRVWQSKELAQCILIAIARRELTLDELDQKTNQKGTVSIGTLRLNEKRWVLRRVKTSGKLSGRGIASIIAGLAQNDDRPFFIELGSTLRRTGQSKEREPEVEWDCVNPLACFLVDGWCSPNGNTFLPPLCLFENKALAALCSFALGNSESDGQPSYKAVRKWVSRLRLRRGKHPKIASIKVTNDRILFLKA